MRIATVGKGGSGKSTCAALLALHYATNARSVTLADADLNIHLPLLLDPTIPFPESLHLSRGENPAAIRRHLLGRNFKIGSIDNFVKTTPPGEGSFLISLQDPEDQIILNWTQSYGGCRLMVVGTYEADCIGTSCYHNNLGILENVISHLDDSGSIFIADMVAGTDSFANSLYCQFDAIVMTVEPSRQSVEVAKSFLGLAKAGGVENRIILVANKIRKESDSEYLRSSLSLEIDAFLPFSEFLVECEQDNKALSYLGLELKIKEALANLADKIGTKEPECFSKRLSALHEVHRKYCAQEYIFGKLGDLQHQIDSTFLFGANGGKSDG